MSVLDATSSSPTPPPIPIILLKTPSTPTDAYKTYFTTPSAPSTTSPPKFNPVFLPLLQHTLLAPALSHLHTLLTSPPPSPFPQKYGGIILTSQRAVEALDSVLSSTPQDLETVRDLAIPLYTVGPATHRALQVLQEKHLPRCGIEGQETGSGEKLAEYILQHYSHFPATPGESRGTEAAQDAGPRQRLPLLFLVGETRPDVIPTALSAASLPAARRVRVDELVVYATRLRPDFTEELSRTLCRCGGEGAGEPGDVAVRGDGRQGGVWGEGGKRVEGEGDMGGVEKEQEGAEHVGRVRPIWIVVFSPAGCGELVQVLQAGRGKEGGKQEGKRVFVATIGPTTRDVLLQEHGWEVDVCAERPSPEGLGEGIMMFMRERGMGKWVGRHN